MTPEEAAPPALGATGPLGTTGTLGRALGALDAVQSLGLTVLFLGLGVSEAAKSAGLFLAVLGFAGKLALGYRPDRRGVIAQVALGAFFLSAVLSLVLAEPGFGRPRELFTLALTLVAFPLVVDSCRRPSRRVLFAASILAGACAASLLGYASHMAGPYRRLVLGSVENAVTAAEYLAAAIVFGLPVLFAERRSPVAGPLVALAVGASAVALGMTLSRGPLVGAVAGAAVAVAALSRRRLALVFLVAAALAVLALAFVSPGARVVSESPLASRTAHSRVDAWEEAVDRWSERPLTGHGPGSYALLGVYFEDGVNTPEHQRNAHNVLLNTAAETGVIGCGTLLLFLVLTIRGAVRSLRTARWRLDRAVFAGALGGVAALLVAGVFSVSIDAEPGVLLFSLLAVGVSGGSEAASPAEAADGRG